MPFRYVLALLATVFSLSVEAKEVGILNNVAAAAWNGLGTRAGLRSVLAIGLKKDELGYLDKQLKSVPETLPRATVEKNEIRIQGDKARWTLTDRGELSYNGKEIQFPRGKGFQEDLLFFKNWHKKNFGKTAFNLFIDVAYADKEETDLERALAAQAILAEFFKDVGELASLPECHEDDLKEPPLERTDLKCDGEGEGEQRPDIVLTLVRTDKSEGKLTARVSGDRVTDIHGEDKVGAFSVRFYTKEKDAFHFDKVTMIEGGRTTVIKREDLSKGDACAVNQAIRFAETFRKVCKNVEARNVLRNILKTGSATRANHDAEEGER